MAVTKATVPAFTFPHRVPVESIHKLLQQGIINPMEALVLYKNTMGTFESPLGEYDVFTTQDEYDKFIRDSLDLYATPGLTDMLDEGTYAVDTATLLERLMGSGLDPIEKGGVQLNPITLVPVDQTPAYVPPTATPLEQATARKLQEATRPGDVFTRFLSEQMPGFADAPAALRTRARFPLQSLLAQYQMAGPWDTGPVDDDTETTFYDFLLSRLADQGRREGDAAPAYDPTSPFGFRTRPQLGEEALAGRQDLIAQVLGLVGQEATPDLLDTLTQRQIDAITSQYADRPEAQFDLSLLRGERTAGGALRGFPRHLAWAGAQGRRANLQRRFDLERALQPTVGGDPHLGSFLSFLRQGPGEMLGRPGLQGLLTRAHEGLTQPDPFERGRLEAAIGKPEQQYEAVLGSLLSGMPGGMHRTSTTALQNLFDKFQVTQPEISFLDIAKQYGLF